jgi:Ca-activated chloride channel family protein
MVLACSFGLGLAIASLAPAGAVGLLSPANDAPQLDLRNHQVNVVVEDGYAITTIRQTFANPHAADLEATYSFPVPRDAAVSEFTYWIDGKPVTAEVLEKQKAREIYDQEKQAGRETGLAEQDDYRTFDIQVWPVRASSDVQIRLAYMQPAKLDTGIGRYLYPLEEGGVDEQKLAFWTANQIVTGSFSFDLHLRTGYTVEALRLPKHPTAQISQDQDGSWRVHMDNATAAAATAAADPAQPGTDRAALNGDIAPEQGINAQSQPVRLDTDIAVYWRQKADEPARVEMVPYKRDETGRGTFMLTLTPGMDLKPIAEGRDWVFVLDQSGSMSGKIATLAEGVAEALGKLRPEDRFRIVFFNNQTLELTAGFMPVTPEQVSRAINQVRSVQAGGGTNLYAGLQRGLDALDGDRTGAIVLVTDGVANVGKTQTRDFFDLMKKKDVRLFTAIMGNSANVPLLEPMTNASGGFAVNVSNADDIAGTLLQATSKVTHEALHGLKLKVHAPGSAFRIDDIRRKDIATLYRGEQLVLLGHYWGQGEATLRLSGEISGNPVSYETRFSFPETAGVNPEIERLWAYAEIEREMTKLAVFGPDEDVKTSIIDTSKEFGILTPYTSMLVVREARFEDLAIKRSGRDRLAIETKAQEVRKTQPVRSVRVDNAKPMFTAPQPNHSGGGGSGAVGLPGLILAFLALIAGLRARRTGLAK